MHLNFIFILSLIVGSWAACPPAEDILPCECDEERLRIYCNQQDDPEAELWDIKSTFDLVAQLVPSDFIFEELGIAHTTLKTIPAGAIQTIKFNKINIEANYQLTYIHPDAFGETANVTTTLTIALNPSLTNAGEGHTERDGFDVIAKFKAAIDIYFYNNGIKIIPDGGFGPLPNLKTFRFTPLPPSTTDLTRIGSRAFSQLPNLTFATLGFCGISVNEIADDAFEGIGLDVDIPIENNDFRSLPQVPFKPLLDNARHTNVGGEECYWWGSWICNDIKFDCRLSAWMCEDVEKYQAKINGFACSSGGSNIWDYCAKKASNK